MGVDLSGPDQSFEDWYRREHPRLLALLTVVAEDAELARDATAEAFVRALERWARVASMDEPTAWTYRVGVNLSGAGRGGRGSRPSCCRVLNLGPRLRR